MRAWPGLFLGFALGGFFDGILLHQILQWHHLLSAIDPENARFQVAADGWFHALMYALAAAAIWGLWRAQAQGRGVAGGRLLGQVLVGFGLWHLVDAVLSHWLLGIHRIRMDSADPLVWDLGWLVGFGLVPLALGWILRGRSGGGSSGVAASLATLVALGSGAWAARPADSGFTTVVFGSHVGPAEAFAAAGSVGGVAWADASGRMLVVRRDGQAPAWSLYARGALLVSGAALPAGCFGAVRI